MRDAGLKEWNSEWSYGRPLGCKLKSFEKRGIFHVPARKWFPASGFSTQRKPKQNLAVANLRHGATLFCGMPLLLRCFCCLQW